MFWKQLLTAVCLLPVWAMSYAENAESSNPASSESDTVVFVDGKHYTVLNEPLPTVSKAEVTKFFYFGCPS